MPSDISSFVQENAIKIITGAAAAFLIAKFILRTFKKAPSSALASSPKYALHPDERRHFTLKEKIILSHNSRLYRFSLQTPDTILGLPIGKHMIVSANIDGKDVSRPYTPTSSDDEVGYFDLVIKVYEQGQMSRHIDSLAIGDLLAVKGPKGRFEFKPNMKKHFGMIAGGTGITPMYQVINAVLKNPEDKTEISLLYANVSADDILLKKELDALAAKHSNFKIYYVLNNPPSEWTGGVGFITEEMIRTRIAPPSDDMLFLLCGPLPMIKAMQTHLDTINYKPEMIFKF